MILSAALPCAARSERAATFAWWSVASEMILKAIVATIVKRTVAIMTSRSVNPRSRELARRTT